MESPAPPRPPKLRIVGIPVWRKSLRGFVWGTKKITNTSKAQSSLTTLAYAIFILEVLAPGPPLIRCQRHIIIIPITILVLREGMCAP